MNLNFNLNLKLFDQKLETNCFEYNPSGIVFSNYELDVHQQCINQEKYCLNLNYFEMDFFKYLNFLIFQNQKE